MSIWSGTYHRVQVDFPFSFFPFPERTIVASPRRRELQPGGQRRQHSAHLGLAQRQHLLRQSPAVLR